jgi:hypothetical protein
MATLQRLGGAHLSPAGREQAASWAAFTAFRPEQDKSVRGLFRRSHRKLGQFPSRSSSVPGFVSFGSSPYPQALAGKLRETFRHFPFPSLPLKPVAGRFRLAYGQLCLRFGRPSYFQRLGRQDRTTRIGCPILSGVRLCRKLTLCAAELLNDPESRRVIAFGGAAGCGA